MKVATIFVALSALATTVTALPPAEDPVLVSRDDLEKRQCGAEDSCNGPGGGDLCNDRCKKCSGPSGSYSRGECCGPLWQRCCCYYD